MFLPFLIRTTFFVALWLVLTGAAASSLVHGLPGSALAALLSLFLLPPAARTVRPLSVALLMPHAVGRIASGAVDVARRALAPSMPLDPGWVEHRVRLPQGGARLALTSETSLFPGSLVAARRGDTLLVHCLDRRQDIAGEFDREERRLAKALGTSVEACGE